MTQDQTTPGAPDEPWWNQHRGHYSDELVEYIRVEAAAMAVKQFQSSVVPAVLQHPDYAEANLLQYLETVDTKMIDRTRDVRARRRELFLSGRMEASFVLHGSALQTQIGSQEIMLSQRAWLQELDSSGRASIKVTEDDVQEGPFTLFTVGEEVVAFANMGKEIATVDDDRRNTLITVFDNLYTRAVPIRDYPFTTAKG
jgi:hypothetical protein